MKPTYYSAAWTDSGFLLGCPHEHETIVEAVACIPCAGGYVVGTENGVMCSLSPEEESEFQAVIRDFSKYPPPHAPVSAAGSVERARLTAGYTVMTPIRMVDHWTWTTWMCFETRAQAMEHARKHDKVVRFSSDEWAALKQQKWREPPHTPDPPMRAQPVPENLPSRAEGEPLLEFVLRLLNAVDPAGLLPIEGQEDDRSTSESDEQTSKIETPTYIARLILSRLSESEIRKLKILTGNDLLTFLNVLRNRSHAIVKSKSRYQ